MTIRIVSQEQIRFDVDVETYNRIIRDVTVKVTEACQDSITAMIATGLSNNVMESIHENIDMSTIAQYFASSLNYGRFVDFC